MAQNCEGKEYRASSHAGTWYPGEEKELKEMIQTNWIIYSGLLT